MTAQLRRRGARWLLALVVAGVFALLQFLDLLSTGPAATDDPAAGQPSGPIAEGTYHQGKPVRLGKLLRQVEIVEARPSVPGYDRDCGTGHACSFGPSWSDDVDAEHGHNGCDQRNDMLRASLTEVQLRPDTNGCVVEAGSLDDPYTGRTIQFEKARAHEVQVDHLYPLARAWDMGAASWSPEQRQNFAGDPRNLIVADGPANASKGDQGPGEWLPLNTGYRCTYVARYLEVAAAYDLPITESDRNAAELLATHCSPRKGVTPRNPVGGQVPTPRH